jgi:hypothetical protein
MKLSLFGRAEKNIENYLDSDLGKHFYTKEYLDGIMLQRKEIGVRQAKTASGLLITTTFLAFFDSVAGNITLYQRRRFLTLGAIPFVHDL